MENKLKAFFDLQKFSPNLKLSALISETEKRCIELSDLELANVSAAGEVYLKPEEKNDGNI